MLFASCYNSYCDETKGTSVYEEKCVQVDSKKVKCCKEKIKTAIVKMGIKGHQVKFFATCFWY